MVVVVWWSGVAVINGSITQNILKENVRPSVGDLRLKTNQHNDDPKHTSKSTSDWLMENKIKILERPSQSTDLYHNEIAAAGL